MAIWSRIRERRRWAVGVALLPFAILIATVWGSWPDLVSSDWVQYMAHAEALLDGRPYTDTGYLFTGTDWGFAPRAYPPGLPITLALAFAAFGVSVGVAKAVVLVMAVGLLVVSGIYFARASHPAIGACVALLVGLSPRVLEHSVSPMSDVPFAALVWLTILLVDREGTWDLRRALVVIATAGVAILFRPHGLVLIPALLVWGVASWRRGHGWQALLPGGVLLGLTMVGRLALPDASLRGFPALATLWRHLISPDLRYHLAVFESHLYPFGSDLGNDVFHVFTTVLMLVGLGALVRRNPLRFAVVFGVSYGLMLAAMPGHQARFAFPLYPLFVFGLLNGVRVLAEGIAPRRALVATGVCAVGLAMVALGRGLAAEPGPRRLDDPELVGLVEHLASRVRDGDELRVVSFRPRYLAARTGAPGLVLVRRIDEAGQLGLWCEREITDVVLGGLGIGGRSDLARRTMALRPDAFERMYANADFEVFRMDAVRAGC